LQIPVEIRRFLERIAVIDGFNVISFVPSSCLGLRGFLQESHCSKSDSIIMRPTARSHTFTRSLLLIAHAPDLGCRKPCFSQVLHILIQELTFSGLVPIVAYFVIIGAFALRVLTRNAMSSRARTKGAESATMAEGSTRVSSVLASSGQQAAQKHRLRAFVVDVSLGSLPICLIVAFLTMP
jgi:hypothetical protein